jgi:signal transduction histidine kinase
MIKPDIPANEKERLRNLKGYKILDTIPEEDFDDITKVASQICQTPISLITLIDEERQWFKSHHGLAESETPKEYAFCAHAINEPDDMFIVHDSRLDKRFHDNPLVTGHPHVIFYTGIPLKSPEGFAIGTLCVLDNKPKVLSEEQLSSLKALSRQVVKLFESRKNKELLEESKKELELKNVELERFASVAAHDLKSPLHAISGLIKLIYHKHFDKVDEELKEIISYMDESTQKLIKLIAGILEHSKSEKWLTENKVKTDLNQFFEEIIALLDPGKNHTITYTQTKSPIVINKIALAQIFINLITNSIKYNDKENIVIKIGFSENDEFYNFYITDNGPGISLDSQARIFNLFDVEALKDRFGNRGNGIGLATVKKLIEGQYGSINVESELKKSTTFKFSIAK